MAWVSITNHAALLAERQTMLQRLDPVTRARVLAALLGLIILGCAMMLLAWLGARAARRYRQRTVHRVRSKEAPQPSPASKPKKPPASDLDASDGSTERSGS